MLRFFFTLVLSSALIVPGIAQEEEPLQLQQAISIALKRNPQHKAALAEVRIGNANVKEARSSFFPHVSFSESAVRSNDPVFVFGTRLRQSRFTAADFALNRLNNPTPIGNFATRFAAQWNAFDSFASFFNQRRTEEMKNAASERLARADQLIVFRVIRTYYAALFAARQQELAERAAATAQAVVNQSRSRFEAGTTVESDFLAAQVDSAVRQQELVRARNALAMAQAELDIAMGVAADRRYSLTDQLTEMTARPKTLAEAEQLAVRERPDLKEMAGMVKAGEAGVKAAKSSFGPRINIFADSELDNVSPFANGSNNWMAGAELQLDLFTGGQKKAALSRAQADLDRTEALRQTAEDTVRLDVRRAYYENDSARQTLEVSRAAVAQAEEGVRIVSNRYGAGMTTITDVLRAEDAARSARTNYWEAVYHCAVSYAALELATGKLNANFTQSPSPGAP